MMVESGILGSVHELEDLEAVEAEIIDEYEEDITCNKYVIKYHCSQCCS